MRVMHVITGLRTGGAENQLLLLSRHTQCSVAVTALTNADEIADTLRSEGIEVTDLGMRSNRDMAALLGLFKVIRRWRPDVVHLHLYRATVYGRVAAWLARVPLVITTEHSLLDGQLEGRSTTAAVRRLYVATEHFNDATIAVSRDVADRLAGWGVPTEKIYVIPNGVDLEALRAGGAHRERVRRELGLGPHVSVIGGIGRLHRAKRWDMLLRAMASELGPDLQIVLAGSGEDEAEIRDVAAQLRIAPWVHLIGSRADLPAVLSAMDVVVSTAPQETFGLALVEAAVAGLPVVYVSSPGLDAAGHLAAAVRVRGVEHEVRDAVLTLLASPHDGAEPSPLDRYDVRQVAQEVDALYRRLSEIPSRRLRRRGGG